MLTNEVGIPVVKSVYRIRNVEKEKVLKRYIDEIKEKSWLIDEKFREYVLKGNVKCKVVDKLVTKIVFSCSYEITNHYESTYTSGYDVSATTSDGSSYSVTPRTSTVSGSYTTTERTNFWFLDYDLHLTQNAYNMYDKYDVHDNKKLTQDEKKIINTDEKTFIELIKKYSGRWNNSKIYKNCRGYTVKRIELLHYELYKISVEFEGKEYCIDNILPCNVVNFQVPTAENAVALSNDNLNRFYELKRGKSVYRSAILLSFIAMLVMTIEGLFLTLNAMNEKSSVYRNYSFLIFILLFVILFCSILLFFYIIIISKKLFNPTFDTYKTEDKMKKKMQKIKTIFAIVSTCFILFGLFILFLGLKLKGII